MIFDILALELEDFKSYYGENVLEFPKEVGLFYLTGRNDYNRRLGANGTGKSTLIDATNWVLYGKTSRGLRAGDVIAWGQKKCRVAISLLIGEDEYEIERTQNPNKIRLNGKTTNQDEIQKLIGLNQEAFNCSVILPQFGTSFFDQSPTQKLTLFSQVMDLDFWLDRSKLASDRALDINSKLDELQKKKSNAQGTIKALSDNFHDYKEKARHFDEDIKRSIKSKLNEKEAASESLEGLRKRRKAAEKVCNDKKAELKTAREAYQECSEELNECTNLVRSITNEVKPEERRIAELKVDLEEMESLKGDVCPTCLQVVDDKHVGGYREKVEGKIEKAKKRIKKLTKNLNKHLDKGAELREDLDELKKIVRELEIEYSDAQSAYNSLDRKVSSAENAIKAVDASLKEIKSRENPFLKMVESAKDNKKVLKKKIKELNAAIEEQQAKYEAASYWVNGFKRIRLFVIEEALIALEVEINNLLITLGLVDWRVTLDVERENKSGGVTKGFSVFIHSPKTDAPVRWESWSGGETQRLRMAGNLGLANLIMEQAGYESRIEIIDEPSEHMSREGIEDLVDTIARRAETSSKACWLVDHNVIDFGGFAGKLITRMDDKGHSKLEWG